MTISQDVLSIPRHFCEQLQLENIFKHKVCMVKNSGISHVIGLGTQQVRVTSNQLLFIPSVVF